MSDINDLILWSTKFDGIILEHGIKMMEVILTPDKKRVATYITDKNECPLCGSKESGQCGPCCNIRFCLGCGAKFTFPHTSKGDKTK